MSFHFQAKDIAHLNRVIIMVTNYTLYMFCFRNISKFWYFYSKHSWHPFLQDIKHQMNNCTLIGDRGYLSTQVQTDLFNYANIKLDTPMRSNQKIIKSKKYILENQERESKRYFDYVESSISQLCDQFKIRNNYEKSFNNFKTSILSKNYGSNFFYSICKCFVFNRKWTKLKYL